MKGFLSVFIFMALIITAPVKAQEDFVMGEVLDEPQCFNVMNTAPYNVYGSIVTNLYMSEQGVKARHRSNFRLAENEQVEFCTYGPFYPGRQLELTLRTLVPVFTCMTGIEGDIVIKGKRKPEGGAETWAECL